MDRTLIVAHILKSQVAAYRTQKEQVTQNVFTACTFSMYFYYVFSS